MCASMCGPVSVDQCVCKDVPTICQALAWGCMAALTFDRRETPFPFYREACSPASCCWGPAEGGVGGNGHHEPSSPSPWLSGLEGVIYAVSVCSSVKW